MYAIDLYPMLFATKWLDSEDFLDALQEEDHPMWGAGGAGRTFSYEILRYGDSSKWHFLADRVDDLSILVEQDMRKKLPHWRWLAYLGKNAMSKHIDSTYAIAVFLMNRHTASLKNLLDVRYLNHIKIDLFDNEKLYYELHQEEEDDLNGYANF